MIEPYAHQDEYVGWLRQQIRYHISKTEWLARQTKLLLESQMMISDLSCIGRFSRLDEAENTQVRIPGLPDRQSDVA